MASPLRSKPRSSDGFARRDQKKRVKPIETLFLRNEEPSVFSRSLRPKAASRLTMFCRRECGAYFPVAFESAVGVERRQIEALHLFAEAASKLIIEFDPVKTGMEAMSLTRMS